MDRVNRKSSWPDRRMGGGFTRPPEQLCRIPTTHCPVKLTLRQVRKTQEKYLNLSPVFQVTPDLNDLHRHIKLGYTLVAEIGLGNLNSSVSFLAITGSEMYRNKVNRQFAYRRLTLPHTISIFPEWIGTGSSGSRFIE